MPDMASYEARVDHARAALKRADYDAVGHFDALAADFPDDGDIAIWQAEALELFGDTRAPKRLAALVAANPGWAAGHMVLARMLWEAGDPAFDRPLRAAIQRQPDNALLRDVLIGLLAGIDCHATAADEAEQAARITRDERFLLAEATLAGNAGDADRAERIFAKLPPFMPGRALREARHRIRRGQLDEALQLLEIVLAQEPGQISAWALIDVVWRAMGDSRSQWLHGQPGLIRAWRLPFGPIEIAETVAFLEDLHRAARHPPGQSMRGGTQTRGTLLARTAPEIVRLRQAINTAVQMYWNALPPIDTTHPLLQHRGRTPAVTASWSVRLSSKGRHLPHVHPSGLVSSASYWMVPDGTDGGQLDLGVPPPDLQLTLPPIASFAPQPGVLILFPSTLHHGTRPFESGSRLTVAFDVT